MKNLYLLIGVLVLLAGCARGTITVEAEPTTTTTAVEPLVSNSSADTQEWRTLLEEQGYTYLTLGVDDELIDDLGEIACDLADVSPTPESFAAAVVLANDGTYTVDEMGALVAVSLYVYCPDHAYRLAG